MVEFAIWATCSLDEAATCLNTLSDELRPTQFSTSDSRWSPKDLVSSAREYENFVSRNPSGFALRGRAALFDLSPFSRGCVLRIYPRGNSGHKILVDAAPSVISALGKVVLFGLVCDEEELKHRNHWFADFG